MVDADTPFGSLGQSHPMPAAGESRRRRNARVQAARRSTLLFAGLFAGLLVLAGGGMAYHRAALWVDHTHRVLTLVERVLTSLTEAETGQRGYLLTHDRRYLQPYDESRTRTRDLLDRTQALTADNPAQQENVRSLRELAEAKLDELALTLDQAGEAGPERALATVREGSGERLMTAIRERIAVMRAEEDRLLEGRSRQADRLWMLIVGYAAAFAAAAAWTARSSFRRLEDDYRAEMAEGEALAAALRRNSALLDEVNHRVKNSLQVVSNLLRTQALKHPDATVRAQLLDGSGRVDAIAEVHRRLYGTDLYDTVEITDLLRSIAESAAPFTATAEHAFHLTAPDPVPLPVQDAIPVALIVNELLTNSHKHAFPDGRTGTIRLDVEADGRELRIAAADDGIGLPEGTELREGGGFGLGLVRLLVAQLKGTLAIQRTDPGTRFVLRIPHTQGHQTAAHEDPDR